MRSRGRFVWAGSGLRGGRGSSFRPALGLRGILGFLLGLILLAASPISASAAECTNTWTGPAEGTWTTAANWSAGHVPTSTEVACIGSGKTVKLTTGTHQVGIVQGEGKLQVEGSSLELVSTEEVSSIGYLTLGYLGNLTGAGTLEVAKTFLWYTGGKLSGSGSVVLAPGSTGSVKNVGSWAKLSKRTLINEGNLSVNEGGLGIGEGGLLENTGILTVNDDEGVHDILQESGGGTIRNLGIIQKTSGTGETNISVNIDNSGTIDAQTGKLALGASGTTGALKSGSVLEGSIRLVGPSFTTEDVDATAATVFVREASLSVASGETTTIGTLTLDYKGNLAGAGTLEVTKALSWLSESTMSGTGSTVLGPSAVGTITTYWAYLAERVLVNEGSLNFEGEGTLRASKGATVENQATLNANSTVSYARYPGILTSSGVPAPLLVNDGTLQRVAGSGDFQLAIAAENYGTINGEVGKLVFNQPGATALLAPGSIVKGKNRFEKSNIIGDDFEVPSGELVVREGLVTLEGKDTKIANFGVDYKTTVTGPGDVKVTQSFVWSGGTLSGSGKMTLAPGTVNTLNGGVLEVTLAQRELVNEGSFTQVAYSYLKEAAGAVFRNKGTYTITDQPYPLWVRDSIRSEAGPVSNRFINEGLIQRTGGSSAIEVFPGFENHGVIKEQSGKLEIKNPVTVPKTEQFGKRSNCGDPVECATGNFYETQTDFAIGGRGVGLYLTRTYSAQAAAAATSPGIFGYGWTHSFSEGLAVEGGGEKAILTRSNGSTIPFTKVSGSTYAAPPWSQDTLSGSPEAGYTLIGADRTQLDFSGIGKLESVIDRNGNETTLAYDEAGRLKTIEDPAGRQITLSYNEAGQVESAEDPMGHVVKYTYEAKHLKTVTMPGEEGARWQFKYDGSHRMTEMVDGRGGKTTNEYDASSRVKSQTDPGGHTLTFEYAPFHTKVTNKATGAVTDQWFTSNNQPYSVTRGFGTADATTEIFSYNEAGQLTAVTDGNGHTTTYAYDAQGNLKSEKDAEGNETKWAHNGTHDVISMTTPGGETITIERDGNGNVESISRPGPEETTQTTTFDHNEFGQLENVTDPLERTWVYGYNEQGDRIAATDPEGNTRSFEYDENSRLEAIISPRGNAEGAEASEYMTMIERDQQGRPLKVIDPLGHASEYAYDANGSLEKKTNANGHTTKYTYNADNERTKVEKPNGAILETGYDGAGNVTSQTDGNKKTTTYVRNALGQPVEVIDPLSRKTIEEFDDAGNLKAVVDPAERKTSYAYDKADRLIGIDYSNEATPDVELEYDANGNVTSMVDGTGESTFEYDELGRLTASENGNGDVVGYDYDLAEQITSILYPNGKSISRTFDEAGRLETVTDWLGGMTSFGYDADSNLEEITFPVGTGNVDEYEYDPTGRMSAAKFVDGPEALASLSYTRDKIGQVEEEARSGLPGLAEVTFGYDENERLIEAGEANFEYDPADNLTKAPGTTNTYDAASQLETSTGIAYTYSKLGERTKAIPEVGPATTYDYDQAGNLISIERPEEGEVPAIEETLAYDGSGLLASKASGLATQYLTWDLTAPQPLLLNDDQNSYVYGPNGLPITQISSEEEPTYLHHDQLGSTRMLTDSSGKVIGTFSFSPYGTPEGSTGTATTPLGFAGQYTDSESGLQYLRARFYDPATAQFLTKDPLAAILRTPYGYANQSPLHYVDPSGMSCVGVGHYGPVSFPTLDPGDCIEDAAGAAAGAAADAGSFALDHSSLVIAPVVFAVCVFEPELCTKGALVGAGVGTGANVAKEATDPCFNFWSATLHDLLVTLAAALPGGVFDATAGRYGPQLGPVARRVIQALLEAPGLILEVVRGAKPYAR
jgi:RHS repeat-associated protein